MNEVRVRLLYPPSVRPDEVGAAIRGMERFRAYGVFHDSAGLGGDDRAALRSVKGGNAMRRMITAPNPAIGPYDFSADLSEMFLQKDIIPLGLTPERMNELVDTEFTRKRETRLGLSREGLGAVISLSQSREMAAGMAVPPYRDGMCSGLAPRSIELAVMHELGHVFGKQGHCEKKGCLMQANENFADFIDRFVREGLGICRDCSSKISSTICSMAMGI